MTPTDLAAALTDVAEALTNRMGTHRVDLERLVEIPSVSAPGFDPGDVRRSADAVAELLRNRRFDGVRLLEVDGAHPAVYGERLDAGPDAPTVLCYAHHDVQPPGDPSAWRSPAFAPTERDGRLYGRGTADDKGGVVCLIAAVDAWLAARGAPPVNVKVFFEGEEEIGSPNLATFLESYRDVLVADVVVLCDAANWREGVGTLTYLLRGLVDAEVTLRSTEHALHSGMYGGPIPDPVAGLAKLLGGLLDEQGEVAIPGFSDDAREPSDAERERIAALDFDEGSFRAEAGLRPGVPLAGDPERHPLERLWNRPALAVIGLDAPSVDGSSNTLQAEARGRVSARLAPGQDPERARDLLCRHLAEAAPWGLEVEVAPGAAAPAFVADPAHPAFEAAETALEAAYGAAAALAGIGGTIPFVDAIARAFAKPDGSPAPALLTAVADPDSRAHGIDESMPLDDWHRACLAHAYLLGSLAETELR